MSRAALALFLLLLATSARADESAVWEPSQILDAEQIAESGAFVPLEIPTFFDNFRYPFLQKDESVIFIANDRTDEKKGLGREGIYSIAKNGEVRKLAEVGDYFAGGTARMTWVAGLRVDRNRAVFRCGLDDGGTGIGMWANDSLELLARTGYASGFDELGYPGFSGNTVSFVALSSGGAGELYVLDLASLPRTARKIADRTTPIPGYEGKFFGSFGFQQEADGEHAVFRGFDVGAREILIGTKNRALALGGVFRQDIFSKAAPEKIIDTAMPLPGGPPGATFAELENAIPCDGTVVVSSYSREHSGIYYVGRNGKPRLVADTNTRIPDLFDGPFTRFDKWTANCSPWVIFRGYAEDGYEGLFAMHVERNELFLLLDTHSELGGKKASGFEISSTPKLGEDLVLAIGFTDGSSGIYILKFGDGWGKAVFRRASEKADSASPAEAERGAGILQNFSGAGVVDAPPVPAGSAVRTQAEFIEEGSFRMVGAAEAHEEPLAASGKATPYSDAKLIEAGSVFPARQGLFFGYRYELRAEGGDRCYVEGFDTRIIHPPMRGPNGKEQTESIVPLHVCFEDGKAEDFLTYGLEEDFEMLPGQWMLQVRKDGEVLVSRTFTIL